MKEHYNTFKASKGSTWAEIGNELGVTRERARQIFGSGIKNFARGWLEMNGEKACDERVEELVNNNEWINAVGGILRGDDYIEDDDVVNIDEEEELFEG